jgi:predicted nucleic acid-binding protein
MQILLDSNILLRIADQDSEFHSESLDAIDRLHLMGHECVIVPQVLYEYWVVATRPVTANGLGATTLEANTKIGEWLSVFTLKHDQGAVFSHWRRLVSEHDVKGKKAHDARLVAAAFDQAIDWMLTYNKADFSRFHGIKIDSPGDVLAMPI